jgi:cytochrome b
MSQRILVWDLPLRIFHWALAACFLGAFLTAESERQRDLHILFGATIAGLIAFRVLWAFVGTRYARVAAIRQSPASLRRYVASLLRGAPERHVGHNPPGALAIPALLGMCLATAASGWALHADLGGEWVEEAHEALAFATLALVGIHVVGVLASGFLHRENLVRAMITGTKHGEPGEAIASARPLVALLLVAAIAAFWADGLRDGAARRERRGSPAAAVGAPERGLSAALDGD